MEEKTGHGQEIKCLKYKLWLKNCVFWRLCQCSCTVQSMPWCVILSRCPWTAPDGNRTTSTGLRLFLYTPMSLTLNPY